MYHIVREKLPRNWSIYMYLIIIWYKENPMIALINGISITFNTKKIVQLLVLMCYLFLML